MGLREELLPLVQRFHPCGQENTIGFFLAKLRKKTAS
jgi:hypothetical protein